MEAVKKTKAMSKNTEADKKIKKMSENIERSKQKSKMSDDTDEDNEVYNSELDWDFVLVPENIESDKKNEEEKIKKNIEATKEIKKTSKNTNIDKKIDEMIEKQNKIISILENIRMMDKYDKNFKAGEITTTGKEEKKNIEAAKEIENIKRIEKIENKIINVNTKLKKIIKDTEDKKNKEYEKRQIGKNIGATKETIKTSENTNIDKKIEEISEKQKTIEELKEISEKVSKLMSIRENTSKQEATTHKCEKDFKAGEVTTAGKEEKKNIEAAKQVKKKINKDIKAGWVVTLCGDPWLH